MSPCSQLPISRSGWIDMLNITGASEILRLVTSSVGSFTLDVFGSYITRDASGSPVTFTPGNNGGVQITSSTTTPIITAAGASCQRNVKQLSICNLASSADSVLVTVEFYTGSTAFTLVEITLFPGSELYLDENGNWDSDEVMPRITRTVLTSNATYTPNSKLRQATFEGVGAGGGGGGCGTAATNSAAGGGGGAGQYAIFTATPPASSYACLVGLGGAAGAASGAGTGGNGNPVQVTDNDTTTVVLSASGGLGGGADTVAAIHVGGAGGLGGSGGTGDFVGGAESGEAGLALAAAQARSGRGGSAPPFGGGANSVKNATSAGTTATSYGGGGSGACIISGGASQIGGAGAPAILLITERR